MRRPSKLDEPKLDMTPMIDAVFQLIIFFMVTTVFTTSPGLRVDLPKAAESDMPPERDLNIVISKDGDLDLNGQLVTMDDLPRSLQEAKEMYQSKVLIIKADKKTYHEVVVDVMDAAKGVGIDELAIATEYEEKEQK